MEALKNNRMVAETREKYELLLSELMVLDEEYTPDLNIPDQRLLLISRVLEPLRRELSEHIFDEDLNEIRFFKEVMPDILSLFIYYTERSALETSELIGTRKSRAEYRNRLMKRIDEFSTENADFYDYYSLRKSNFDSYYFLRNSPLNREPAVLFGAVIDSRFCPLFSIKIAMISAYRKLDAELSDNPSDQKSKGTENLSVGGLHWTGSKRDLTELAYAIKKYVNNGLTPIKEIIQGFQNLFGIDLGNYPRVYQELLSRKKGESYFLNQLVNDQQKKMEENENERLKRRGFK
jgi:RteC protein